MTQKKKIKKKKNTVGSFSRELQLKDDYNDHSSAEQAQAQSEKYEPQIIECLEKHKKIFPNDFYVIVITKKERLMKNVIRHYFFGRISCPTPDYDQVVYKYNKKDDKLEFIWVIPDKETCKFMTNNPHQVDISQWELLSWVLKFADGSLFKVAKKLNGEKKDTPELIKGN